MTTPASINIDQDDAPARVLIPVGIVIATIWDDHINLKVVHERMPHRVLRRHVHRRQRRGGIVGVYHLAINARTGKVELA